MCKSVALGPAFACLIYRNETMIWSVTEICSIRTIKLDNLRVLLDIRKINRIPNARIKELCGIGKRGG